MECEICGKTATKKAVVEDSLLNVCGSCIRFGKEIREEPKPIRAVYPLQGMDIDPSFSVIVKAKREALGLSRDQLAAAMKEKETVVERVEKGMRPTTAVAKKLEHALKIKLLGYEAEEIALPKAKATSLTLGDVVNVKVRKKK